MAACLSESQVAALARMSPRNVRRRACELRTQLAETASGNGRRARVFPLASLNPALHQAFVDSSNVPPALHLALTPPAGLNLTEAARAEAERRYQIIEPIVRPEAFRLVWAEHRNRRSRLVETIAAQNGISRRTLYAWLIAWKKGGLPGLVKKARQDKGLPRSLNPAALDFLLTAALPKPGSYGELSVCEIRRAYEEERVWRAAHATKPLKEFERRKYIRYLGEDERLLPSAQLPVASPETFRRWFNRIPEAVKALARQGESAFSNNCEILSYRDLKHVQPMDFCVFDHRMLDVFALAPARSGWRLIRPWISACIDMRSRKFLAYVIVQVPSSAAIVSVLKTVLMKWGVPKAIYIDNGRDYRSEWLEGKRTNHTDSPCIGELSDGMRGVLETLSIRVHHAIVRRARSKLIEPAFVSLSNFDRTLPWWVGNKPSARPERFSQLILQHEKWLKGEAQETPFPTIERLAGLYDEFIEVLNDREHTSGEGMEKITPTGRGWMSGNECWEKLIGGIERRTVAPEVMQFAFMKRRRITIRHGEVRVSFAGKSFHYRLVDAPIALVGLNNREVEVAFDPLDLETVALYFEGRFLGFASNAELRRMGEDLFVTDEKNRRSTRRAVKEFIQDVHRSVPMATPEERAARRMAVRPKPVASELHGTEITVPAEIRGAVEAAAEQRRFSFAAASGADLIRAADAFAYEDDADDEFSFFSGGLKKG